MPLNPEQRDRIRRDTAWTALVNAGVAALVVAIALPEPIPLWGPQGMGVMLAALTLALAFADSAAITLATRARVRCGALAPLAAHGPRLPRLALLRAMIIALIITSAFAPPTLALLALTGAGPWPPWRAAVLLAVYLGLVATAVAPVTARAALRDAVPAA